MPTYTFVDYTPSCNMNFWTWMGCEKSSCFEIPVVVDFSPDDIQLYADKS